MKNTMMLWIMIVAIAMLAGSSLHAQGIAGDWQGTLKGAAEGMDLRLIVHVRKSDDGGWSAILYSIDQPPAGLEGATITSVTLQGLDFRFSIDSLHASYVGKLSADGTYIQGTWTGRRVLPLAFERATKSTAWPHELPPHTVSFVTVEKDVKLEVLDYGGSGRALIFLAGLGGTAHVYDRFAPKFTPTYHVYGITRRGYGASSAPDPKNGNYAADRLGDDILAVMESLRLNRPVLVGHSIAGEELSSIGSRHPEKVAGLIYLDAGYNYAYYDRSRGNFMLDAIKKKKKLEQLMLPGGVQKPIEVTEELLKTDLPQIEKDLRQMQKNMLEAPADPGQLQEPGELPAIPRAILEGAQKYTDIRVPILAFFAVPHNQGQSLPNDPGARARLEAWDTARMEQVVKDFESGLPSARVVRLPHADHFVIQSNEADVLREMNAFLSSLH